MNRKASIFFWPFFLLVLLILFGYGLYKVFTKENTINDSYYVGVDQYKLNSAYDLFDSKNLFFQKSSIMSYYDSIYYLYNNGGKFNFNCGQEQGYVLWKVGSLGCFVDKKEFIDSFEKVFPSNMAIYTKDNINMPVVDNLNFVYNENFVYFNTKSKLTIQKDNVEYQDYLYSDVKDNIPVDEIIQVSNEARNYIAQCKDDLNCYLINTQNSAFSWDIKNNGKLFMFDVNTNRKIGLFEKKDLVVRFGVDFKELNPLFG